VEKLLLSAVKCSRVIDVRQTEIHTDEPPACEMNTRAIWKVTSGELLTKQAMRKNYYVQNMCAY
jgi:hypothetical protein